MEPVKVSVVCTVFNHGKYLRDAIEGFVNQKTNFRFEVLVHDDASTDDSCDIIREYEEKYPDIIKPIYQTENQYSQGKIIEELIIPKISGEYVAICEGDDYWIDENKLQKQVDFLDSHKDFSLVACSSKTLNCVTGEFENRFVIDEDREISIEELITEENGRMFQTASVMMKSIAYTDRKAWQSMFPYGDRPMWMRAALDGRVYMLSDVMTVYRFATAGSWTRKNISDYEKGAVNCRKTIKGFEAFDAATDGKYHDMVVNALEIVDYDLARNEHNWDIIREKHYDRYSKLPARDKISVKLHTKYFPLYKSLRKLLG